MTVLDASVLIDVLLNAPAMKDIRARVLVDDEEFCAPHVIDLEVAQVMRRHVLANVMGLQRARRALDDLHDLSLTRYPHDALLPRIWELRKHFTAYDAAYLARAEILDVTLLTRDRAIVRPGHHQARVELV